MQLVATGIWRDSKFNACGLSGEALVVHEIERVLGDKCPPCRERDFEAEAKKRLKEIAKRKKG